MQDGTAVPLAVYVCWHYKNDGNRESCVSVCACRITTPALQGDGNRQSCMCVCMCVCVCVCVSCHHPLALQGAGNRESCVCVCVFVSRVTIPQHCRVMGIESRERECVCAHECNEYGRLSFQEAGNIIPFLFHNLSECCYHIRTSPLCVAVLAQALVGA